MLVKAVRANANIIEHTIRHGLTDEDGHRIENKMIVDYHRFRTGQLWKTIHRSR